MLSAFAVPLIPVSTLTPILHKLMEYLGYEKPLHSGLKIIWDTFNECLQERYGGWKNILKKAINGHIDLALSALRAAREEIVKVCKENHKTLELLAKFATKTCLRRTVTKQVLKASTKIGAREGTKQAVKLAARQGAVKGGAKFIVKTSHCMVIQGTKSALKEWTKQTGKQVFIKQTSKSIVKTATKEGTKQTIKQGSKTATSQAVKSAIKSAATPLSIGADLVQTGLEWAGYKEVGKTVGVAGNIAAGAMAGSVAGPPGAALGALGGFLVWGAGEVVGGLVDRAFGDTCRPTSSEQEDLDSEQSAAKSTDSTCKFILRASGLDLQVYQLAIDIIPVYWYLKAIVIST